MGKQLPKVTALFAHRETGESIKGRSKGFLSRSTDASCFDGTSRCRLGQGLGGGGQRQGGGGGAMADICNSVNNGKVLINKLSKI